MALTALLLALGAEASAKAAQSGTSTISGAVTDSTAGALPGVAVRVVNEDTGVAVDVHERRGISSARAPRTLQLGTRFSF